MAFRGLRQIPSLRSMIARRRQRIRYADYQTGHQIKAKNVAGTKQKDKV